MIFTRAALQLIIINKIKKIFKIFWILRISIYRITTLSFKINPKNKRLYLNLTVNLILNLQIKNLFSQPKFLSLIITTEFKGLNTYLKQSLNLKILALLSLEILIKLILLGQEKVSLLKWNEGIQSSVILFLNISIG